jgi:hypothetical protein
MQQRSNKATKKYVLKKRKGEADDGKKDKPNSKKRIFHFAN